MRLSLHNITGIEITEPRENTSGSRGEDGHFYTRHVIISVQDDDDIDLTMFSQSKGQCKTHDTDYYNLEIKGLRDDPDA